MNVIVVLLSLLLTFVMQTGRLTSSSTASFRLRYDRSVTAKDADITGKKLDAQYEKLKVRLHRSLGNHPDVFLFKSIGQMRKDSKTELFDDGVYKNGKMYLLTSAVMKDEKQFERTCTRLTSRAILSSVRSCPPWLAEAMSLFFSGELRRFGSPAQLHIASFADLSEEFARSESARDQQEVYAKLSSTAAFLIHRYGEEKVLSAVSKFKPGVTVEDVFTKSFGEKMDVIEQAWVRVLAEPIE